MKPLGLTAGIPLRVVKPTRTEDAIWDAVETAIAEGVTPEKFLIEVSDAWHEALLNEAKAVRSMFKKVKS